MGNDAIEGTENTPAVKLKQVKTKVTERVKRDPQGEPISRCWDVQVGSAVVKVYLTPHGDRELYTVSCWVDGKRKRQVLSSFDKAIAEAKALGLQLNKGDLGSADLSGQERVACMRALQLLQPIGTAIEVAAAEYADAITKLKDRASLAQVVEFYLKRKPVELKAKRVADVVKECLESKEQDKLSERYLKQLEYDLNRFAARFKVCIEDVAGRDIDQWLRDLDVSGRTRNNIRMSVQTLFGFAKLKRYVAKDHDEMDAVPVAKEASGAIEIFTPDEMHELLGAASAELVPFLAIGAFAGVRHAEIQRLEWKDVRFDAGIIEIHAGNAKTATRRTVPILPNLKLWLEQAPADGKQRSGPVCPFANVTDQIVSLLTKINKQRAEDSGALGERALPSEGHQEVKWKHNGLRHSFISYRVGAIKNVAQVALEAGNSPTMIFSNYRQLVTPKDAEAWFAITPESTKALRERADAERHAKIVKLPTAAAA